MTSPFARWLAPALAALALIACSSEPDKLPPDNPFRPGKSERELRLEANELYKLARRSLESADYTTAIARYETVQSKYPFSDFATQAQLEVVYAKYRSYDPEGALSVADRFLKEHPRHPAIDYVHYLRGLINFQRGESPFDWIADPAKQDVSAARRAFDDFALLIQRYPASPYAADARLRMIYLRNRIADHELYVVRYYLRRGAWVAAAKRAEQIVADYPGAPATADALRMLEQSYRSLGQTAQADDVARLVAANPLPPRREVAMEPPPPPPLPPPMSHEFLRRAKNLPSPPPGSG
jgi:outer membrane protein assembly factor BamD